MSVYPPFWLILSIFTDALLVCGTMNAPPISAHRTHTQTFTHAFIRLSLVFPLSLHSHTQNIRYLALCRHKLQPLSSSICRSTAALCCFSHILDEDANFTQQDRRSLKSSLYLSAQSRVPYRNGIVHSAPTHAVIHRLLVHQ